MQLRDSVKHFIACNEFIEFNIQHKLMLDFIYLMKLKLLTNRILDVKTSRLSLISNNNIQFGIGVIK